MTRFVFCHHAERADRRPAGEESEKYPGITIKGEKETREKTRILAKMVRDLSDGSIVILGGCSKAIRAASTLALFTDELRQLFGGDDKDILFSERFNSAAPLGPLRKIAKRSGNGKGKIVVDFPLRIEEFIAPPGQREKTMARKLLAGLCGEEGFFRRFFPNNPLILVNIGHSSEMDALINFLHKENGSVRINDKVDFHFM